jgi:hypothetical protein
MRRVWVVVTVAVALASATPSPAGPIVKGQFSRSDTCGECHRDIYRMWRASAHAKAMEDPVFLDAFRQTKDREGAPVARACLECHAPTVSLTKDYDLAQKLSWEGVGCDVCHSIAAVETSAAGAKYRLEVGIVKRGPIKNASSGAHEVLYSELHGQALVCAPCHEFAGPDGTPLMTTYSEWRQSGASRAGKSCQSCHMGRTKANVVDPIVARVPEAVVNLHEVPGGHSLDQLNKALEVGLQPRRSADSLLLDVRLRNRGAGHAVPTGMPGRRVILSVKVRASGGDQFEERRTYGKSFAAADGGAITRDSSYFARGVRLVSDTRLKADEERTERFRFKVPADATAYVTVKLQYEHAPTGTDENRTSITFFSEERALLPEKPQTP